MKTSVVIVGGGPSGLMAAHRLTQLGINYALLDKNAELGRKILLSGGTRCNVTNPFSTKEFIDQLTIKHRKFLYKTLQQFGTKEVYDFFVSQGVPLKLEGIKYFPQSDKSQDIVAVLSKGVSSVYYNTFATDITKEDNEFIVTTNRQTFYCKYLIIATGSNSYPKTGSTGDGIMFAKQFGHQIIPFYPAETHVYSNDIKSQKDNLQGVAISQSIVSIKDTKIQYQGDLLFTHFGLSGPVIQHISEFIYQELANHHSIIQIALTGLSAQEVVELFEKDTKDNQFVLKTLEKITVKRVAKWLMTTQNIPHVRLKELSKKTITNIIENLLRFEVVIDRVEEKEHSFVNGGGVNVKEIHPNSLESTLIPNLYFVGETLDIHGPIGGFNITMALSTGYSAATNIGEKTHA